MSTLCKLDYPIYVCEVLDDNHVVVAGGGGGSKTGVPNAVDILKIEKIGRKIEANPSERLETGGIAAMNMSVLNQGNGKPSLVAIGQGGICKIYSVVRKARSGGEKMEKGVKNRKTKGKIQPRADVNAIDTEHYAFNLLKTLETDFGPDPLQKTVRISRNGKLIVTGGSDGYVRAWNLPDFTKCFYSHGHKDDVTDVDISPDGLHIVSVSRDGTAIIWNASNGIKETDLHSKWNSQMVSREYRFRCCRYGIIIDNPKSYVLFTAHAPKRPAVRKDNQTPQGCLTKWARKRKDDSGDGTAATPLCPAVIQFTGREAISSMSISTDGVFLAVGFMDGSIALYISFSLQCARRIPNLHGIFVTGTTFLPNSKPTHAITGPCDAALVTVSADNTCKLSTLSSRTMFSSWFAMLLIFLALVIAAFLMFHLGII